MIVAEKFWARVNKSDDCWVWGGYLLPNGYGVTSRTKDGAKALAHRAAWQLVNGPIPRGMDICHTCDNPSCARPEHLFVGTRSDNMRDCASKNRLLGSNGKCRGENHPSHKLTWDKVREIRARSNESHSALGREYGVTHRMIRLIRLNEVWRE